MGPTGVRSRSPSVATSTARGATGASSDPDPASGARSVLKRLGDGVPQLGAFLIRADGSGVLTQGQAPTFAWEVTDLRSGALAAVPQMPGETSCGP